MPHLRFRGVSEPQLLAISRDLVTDLAALITSARDNFTLELVASPFIFDGQRQQVDPMVEVLWFARSQEVQDGCAQAITRHLRATGETRDIDVFFVAAVPSAYYCNGVHY